MSKFTEIDSIFVNEFADLYNSGEYKQWIEYGELDDGSKNAYWKLTDINQFRDDFDIGFSPAIYQFTYLLCDFDPLSLCDERLESDTFRNIWDDNRLDIRDDITSPDSMFSKIHKKIQSLFTTTRPVPTLEYFFTKPFTKICEVYRDINTEVQKCLRERPINDLINEDWFTFDEDPSMVARLINEMIQNCLEDPDTIFNEYDVGESQYDIKEYTVLRRTKHNLYMKDNENTKYVSLPCMETCIEIFWENVLEKPSIRKIQSHDHYLMFAHSYNKYKDQMDHLRENIVQALIMLEVDSRFKVALEDLAKSHIDCLGCRENQPNQLAHMGEGGCLAENL